MKKVPIRTSLYRKNIQSHRTHKRVSSTRNSLMDAAAGLVIQQGYKSTSVREIVAAAGTTKPSLYYHFGSKAGLVQALVTPAITCIQHELDQWKDSSESATAQLLIVGVRLSRLVIEHRQAIRFLEALHRELSCRAWLTEINTLQCRVGDHLASIIQRGISDGEFRSSADEELTLIVRGLMQCWVSRTVSRDEPEHVASFSAWLEHVLLGFLASGREQFSKDKNT